MSRHIFAAVLLAVSIAASGASAAPAQKRAPVVEVTPIPDPIEPFNRAVFQFNRAVDFLILNPAASAYNVVLPGFVRDSIHSFLSNLSAPVAMANELLQGDFRNFDIVFRRFIVNSTLGVGGLVDVASHHGLNAPTSEDFGQTMGKWGAKHGFYVILPVLGSSSLRDGTGMVVDGFADPFNSWARNTERDWMIYTRGGVSIVKSRARAGEKYNDVMNNAVDPYVTFRSMYKQNRDYLLRDGAANSYDDFEDAE
jgi:phospholipid-binding lipoprotein MlaA